MLKIILGLFLFSIFFLISMIHFYWGIGGSWAISSTIPTTMADEKVINPKLPSCFLVGSGFFIIGLFILIKAGLVFLKLPNWILNYGLWIISSLFILRAIGEFKYVGLFKKIQTTKFAKTDSKYFTPFCLLLGIGLIIFALI